MKKNTLLNSEISSIISKMGHTDALVISNAGLAIPDNTKRIDLAVRKGVPQFYPTFKAILSELKVESAIIADEFKKDSPELYFKIVKVLKKENISVTYVSHEDFKLETKNAKAVIRTGEFTPYANIILKSGVVF